MVQSWWQYDVRFGDPKFGIICVASFRAHASSSFEARSSFMLFVNFKSRRAFHDMVYCAKFRNFQSLLFFCVLTRTEVLF